MNSAAYYGKSSYALMLAVVYAILVSFFAATVYAGFIAEGVWRLGFPAIAASAVILVFLILGFSMTIRILRTFTHQPLLLIGERGIVDRQGYGEHFQWSDIEEVAHVVVVRRDSSEPMMDVPTLRIETHKPMSFFNKYLTFPVARNPGYRYIALFGIDVKAEDLIKAAQTHAPSSVRVESEPSVDRF